LPSYAWLLFAEAWTTSPPDPVARLELTSRLLSIFPPVAVVFPTTSMSDAMEIDGREPRGTKRTADEAGLPQEAPRRIKPLDQDVVNKIAAGEIIVAPMHALVSSLDDV
jgi:hypothetical protein